ncbi:MAG TPA: Ldh family oxidoreductase [Geminicoccaceae bacterium]|nr:Ldh family oxidoreductase [Geminicoccus sp.]HMU50255.1 Ldh family oxidoreductase [Geminicoccaceae bacterium]
MLIQVEPLKRLLTATFAAAGCPDDEAARVSHYLTLATLTGHESHGVIRTQRYVEWLREGWVLAGQHVKPVLDTDVLAILDGCHGMGQTVGPESARIGIDKARARGVAVVALRNSGHLGRIGDFAEMAAAEKIVSLHFVNVFGSLLVAPFGGAERRFSTNPVAIGVPTENGEPFILDMATALVAEGKVLVASQGGKPIPMGALVSADGKLSNDPHVLYGDPVPGRSPDPRRGTGAMRAFGEHKGSALALACDLLAGALGGSGITRKSEGRVHNGMLSIYLDPETLDTEGTFAADVRDYIAWIKSARPIDPAADVIIPGDKERRSAAERTANGVPLPDDVWHSILYAAALVGIDKARVAELTA